jgi:hypothetical protein
MEILTTTILVLVSATLSFIILVKGIIGVRKILKEKES